MRILSIVFIGLLSMAPVSEALATQWEGQMKPHIHCCMLDGRCVKTRRDRCDLKKGRIVQDCDECKAERDTNRPKK